MNDKAMHFTLRQTQAHFVDRRTWLGILIVGVLVGLVGPFGTFAFIDPLPRLLYWLAVCALSYAAGFAVATGLGAWLEGRLRPVWLRIAVAGVLPGIPIALMVFLINGLSFGFGQADLMGLVTLLVYCPLVSLGVTTASFLLGRQVAPPPALQASALPALLERLPHPQRGRLLHLAVADHYVEVITDKGRALLLLRLSDAIRETAPVRGLQVHRSHWIALDAVRRTSRHAGKPVLELEDGTTVPISRSYLTAVKAAGLLT
ncbi:LytTR family DNA-binding domain-containing protein [Devosia beringensis]|uniref:LytTR family DNA-binding domain-containing protein n=1 Tax=Devosia beringensis TaxID=2657486 RepID=UPI00186B62C2|nr:LytTR family DNA-binding domain-containing protein [Devosia beringensis]